MARLAAYGIGNLSVVMHGNDYSSREKAIVHSTDRPLKLVFEDVVHSIILEIRKNSGVNAFNPAAFAACEAAEALCLLSALFNPGAAIICADLFEVCLLTAKTGGAVVIS
jgi:hypothetical protein